MSETVDIGMHRRQLHIMAVVYRCEQLSVDLSLEERNILMTAGAFHDSGYFMVGDEHHAVKGARAVKELIDSKLIHDLVITHTWADIDIRNQGGKYEYIKEVREQKDEQFQRLFRRLAYADLTADYDGRLCTPRERYGSLIARYGKYSIALAHQNVLQKEIEELHDEFRHYYV